MAMGKLAKVLGRFRKTRTDRKPGRARRGGIPQRHYQIEALEERQLLSVSGSTVPQPSLVTNGAPVALRPAGPTVAMISPTGEISAFKQIDFQFYKPV